MWGADDGVTRQMEGRKLMNERRKEMVGVREQIRRLKRKAAAGANNIWPSMNDCCIRGGGVEAAHAHEAAEWSEDWLDDDWSAESDCQVYTW